MTNIWGFLSQTAEVSVMAILLLLLKTMLKDKLPPRWQYNVWWVMAVAALVPAGFENRYIIRYIHICLQAVKTIVERGLSSRYTAGEKVVYNSSVVPFVTARPESITDWLFVIYVAGIAVLLLRYVVGYVSLGKIISKATDDCAATQLQTDLVAEKYGLDSCRVKQATGITSAFVFGLAKPVLVLPEETDTDDKVILHELLHLKYRDLWQKAVWTVLRTLHWPNILLYYVFNYIDNDMESLCDQRVLERLSGEERRDYGRILLSMTNEKYPSAFGTTSISNGAGFIAQRIKTIARFKKYPQGMGIVSVCIVFMLTPLVANGQQSPQQIGHINYASAGTVRLQMQYEQYKMACCTTPAAAIDAFAKGLSYNTEEFLIAVTPENMEIKEYELPWFADINKYDSDMLYYVVDMIQQDDNTYTAQLMFKDYIRNTAEDYGTRYFIIPIVCVKEKGWSVYQCADYEYYYLEGVIDSTFSPPSAEDYKGGFQAEYTTDYGTLKLYANNISYNDTVDNEYFVYPHTDFSTIRIDIHGRFTVADNCREYENIAVIMASISSLESDIETGEYWLAENSAHTEWVGSSSGPDGMSVCVNVPTDRLFTVYQNQIETNMSGRTKDMEIPQYIQVDIYGGTQLIKSLKVDLKAGEIYEY